MKSCMNTYCKSDVCKGGLCEIHELIEVVDILKDSLSKSFSVETYEEYFSKVKQLASLVQREQIKITSNIEARRK